MIRCAHCKSSHPNVATVRACAGVERVTYAREQSPKRRLRQLRTESADALAMRQAEAPRVRAAREEGRPYQTLAEEIRETERALARNNVRAVTASRVGAERTRTAPR